MADYSRATFYGAHSNNYEQANRPSSHPINKVIIHVTQGSWSSAINWFLDERARASAHYTVRSSDGFIGQSVREKDIGYHAGYYSYNQTSIGIEHEGYIEYGYDWFTDVMYDSSARLTAHLCDKYDVPIDRDHIIGHNEVPGCEGGSGGGVSCHTDPGRYWDWGRYMSLVREYSDGSTGSERYAQGVDNTTPGRFAASGDVWGTSSYSPQKAGKNYRFTRPNGSGNHAWYKIKIPSRGKYAVYGRWPADSGYNDRTAFAIRTVDGFKVRVVDQRKDGGQWVLLGVYTMPAGDRWSVVVMRRNAGSGYIIADAVAVIGVD